MASNGKANGKRQVISFEYGGDGSGYFSDNVTACVDSVSEAFPVVMQALEQVKFEPGQRRPFTVVDYGTFDGGNSMHLLLKVIGAIKERYGADQEVLVGYEDQPNSDFKSLFFRLHGLKNGRCKSILEEYNNVFAVASGTSFYSQCFPSASVHFGISFMAMQCLRDRPCVLKKSVHVLDASEEEKQLFAKHAKDCWEQLLLLRGKELVSDGHMVFGVAALTTEGSYGGQHMFESLQCHWKQMLSDGVISQEEFERSTIYVYFRTSQEITEPFHNQDSPVYKSGLRLHSCSIESTSCRFHDAWIKSGKSADNTEDSRTFAQDFTNKNLRPMFTPNFASALSDRSEQEKNQILEELYRRYEDQVAKEPHKHQFNTIFHCIHFYKI